MNYDEGMFKDEIKEYGQDIKTIEYENVIEGWFRNELGI